MSQLAGYSSSTQKNIMNASYKCLNRIRESSKKVLEAFPFPKQLSYKLACHSLIEEILIEFFLPSETMQETDYEDVHWDDAFKMIEMVAPYKASNLDFFINKTLREEMYTLMRENDEIDEAVKAEREGKRMEETAKKMGFKEVEDIVEEEQEEEASASEDTEDSEEVIDQSDFEVMRKFEVVEDSDSSFQIIEESDY